MIFQPTNKIEKLSCSVIMWCMQQFFFLSFLLEKLTFLWIILEVNSQSAMDVGAPGFGTLSWFKSKWTLSFSLHAYTAIHIPRRTNSWVCFFSPDGHISCKNPYRCLLKNNATRQHIKLDALIEMLLTHLAASRDELLQGLEPLVYLVSPSL